MNTYQKQRNAWLTQCKKAKKELVELARLSETVLSADEHNTVDEMTYALMDIEKDVQDEKNHDEIN